MPRKGENIRKRKDGRWEGRYRIYDATAQKKITKSVYAKTYLDTKQLLARAKSETTGCFEAAMQTESFQSASEISQVNPEREFVYCLF